MLQAAISDCVSFDRFSFQQDGLGASGVHVSLGEIAQAVVITAISVEIDERGDLGPEAAGPIIVLNQYAVLEGLMPAFDLALRLRMARRAAHVTQMVLEQTAEAGHIRCQIALRMLRIKDNRAPTVRNAILAA